MQVEGSFRREIEVFAPIEAIALITDDEADQIRPTGIVNIDLSRLVCGQQQAARHLLLPPARQQQIALFAVGHAQVAMFHGIDQQFLQAVDRAAGVGTGQGENAGQLAPFFQTPELKQALAKKVERTLGDLHAFAQAAVFDDLLQRGADDRHQNFRLKRLGQVVIRAGIQPFANVFLILHGGFHDDRDVLQTRLALDGAQQRHAIHARHLAVEQDEIEGGIPVKQIPGNLTILAGHDLIAFRSQNVFDDGCDDKIIFNQQDARGFDHDFLS